MPAQVPYLGKILFLRYRPKCSQPIRLQDFQMNYFSRINRSNSLIFFHGDTNSQKLKDGGKFLVGHGQKIDVANWSRDCKFTISQERRDGIS